MGGGWLWAGSPPERPPVPWVLSHPLINLPSSHTRAVTTVHSAPLEHPLPLLSPLHVSVPALPLRGRFGKEASLEGLESWATAHWLSPDPPPPAGLGCLVHWKPQQTCTSSRKRVTASPRSSHFSGQTIRAKEIEGLAVRGERCRNSISAKLV